MQLKLKKLFLVFCIIMVSGCATHSPNSHTDSLVLDSLVNSTLVNYVNCMNEAAVYYSPSTEQPREVADAAHSKCGKEFYEHEKSYEDYMTSLVSPSKINMAREKARSSTRETKAQVKGKVIQLVIENRLHK
jgi:hypothetical protein